MAQHPTALRPSFPGRGIDMTDTIAVPQMIRTVSEAMGGGSTRNSVDQMSPETVVGRPTKPELSS